MMPSLPGDAREAAAGRRRDQPSAPDREDVCGVGLGDKPFHVQHHGVGGSCDVGLDLRLNQKSGHKKGGRSDSRSNKKPWRGSGSSGLGGTRTVLYIV